MQSYIIKCQPDIMNKVAKKQVLLKNFTKSDNFDGLVRGYVPLFNLKNSNKRVSFMEMLCEFLLSFGLILLFYSKSCL